MTSSAPEEIAAEFVRRWEDAYARCDAEAIAALYTPDAIFVGFRTAVGRDAIAALLQGIIGQGWTGIRIAVTDVRPLGDVILVANEYTALGSGAKAGQQRDARSSHVLAHSDGEWRSAMHTAT